MVYSNRIVSICILFYTLLVVISSEECKWLNKMNKRDLSMKLNGEGLHRQLTVSLSLGSIERLIECRVLYMLTVPEGMYIDSDSINSSLYRHSFHSRHYFDIEAPAHLSKSHQVSIASTSMTRKQFILSDSFTIPIHLRYHPSSSKGETTISIPRILIDCPVDYTIHSLHLCHTASVKSVSSFAPKWVILPLLSSSSSITVSIPTGDKTMIYPVVGITFTILILSIIYLCKTLYYY